MTVMKELVHNCVYLVADYKMLFKWCFLILLVLLAIIFAFVRIEWSHRTKLCAFCLAGPITGGGDKKRPFLNASFPPTAFEFISCIIAWCD